MSAIIKYSEMSKNAPFFLQSAIVFSTDRVLYQSFSLFFAQRVGKGVNRLGWKGVEKTFIIDVWRKFAHRFSIRKAIFFPD